MYGDSLRDWVVGVIVVDGGKVKEFAASKGATGEEEYKNYLDDNELKKLVLEDLGALAKANNFNSLEKPK